jgi:LPXTG-motif cell wall-anchored protein
MSTKTAFLSVVVTGLLATMTPSPVGATPYDNLTYLTFNRSVQVPGAMLDPGTYRFHLADADSGRMVVQVLSHDGSAVFAMFHTIPDSRTKVTEETTVTFRETPSGVPPAIKSLFYGGEHRGYQFLYGKGWPIVTRTELPQPPVTYTYTPPPMVEAPAPVAAPEPAPLAYEATPAEIFEPVATELPATATRAPWVAVGGFASLVLGLGVGLLRRHMN